MSIGPTGEVVQQDSPGAHLRLGLLLFEAGTDAVERITMARPDKVTTVADIADRFRTSSATVLTEYRGLSVAQLKELRRSLGEGTTYTVVKNTLTKIAAKEAGVEGIDELLVGPSAIAFVGGDVVEAAKGLKTFAKANPALVIKGAVMDGQFLSPQEISKIADLESREVLLAKFAGALNSSLQSAVSLFAAPLSQAVRTVDALRAKVETQGPSQEPAAAEAIETPIEASETSTEETPDES